MNIEEQIRDCAARGMSKTHTAEHLGIRPPKFKEILELMPPLRWTSPQQSMRARDHYESLKGSNFLSAETREKVAEAKRAKHRIHQICGVRGTIRELCILWAEQISVSSDTVARRLRLIKASGVGCLYDAFFAGPIPMHQRKWKTWKPSNTANKE